MTTEVLINGEINDHINAFDRGLQYGDGVFETILVEGGRALFLKEHLDRLVLGSKVLGFSNVDISVIESEINQLLENKSAGVLKIVLTRGVGQRGFLASASLQPTRTISFAERPPLAALTNEGKKLTVCQFRLSQQSALAGIKHLNQLERVMARNEWIDAVQEGLMLDTEGAVIEGTMSNVFIAKDNHLKTPALDYAGVKGVMRQFILSNAEQAGYKVDITTLTLDDVLLADEVFLTNSLMPVWYVSEILSKGKSYSKEPGYFFNWARKIINKDIISQSKQ